MFNITIHDCLDAYEFMLDEDEDKGMVSMARLELEQMEKKLHKIGSCGECKSCSDYEQGLYCRSLEIYVRDSFFCADFERNTDV